MARPHRPRLDPPPEEPPAYEIGFRKPPVASRFKPGRSGNPRGRPRGARNKKPALGEERLKDIILAEAYRTIKVNEGSREIAIPMAQAVVRALAVNAARGQLRSQQLFATLLSETEAAKRALAEEWLKTAIEYKTSWEETLERRAQLGITGPEPLPHPDDVVINVRTGEVVIKGPITKEEKAHRDTLYERVRECDRTIEELTADLKLRKNRKYKQFIEDEITHERKIRSIIVNGIGEPKKR
jgi:Family of unknown function (DUF5681)